MEKTPLASLILLFSNKVSVERAKLDEIHDFLVVENGHNFIMRDDVLIGQILYFLKNGVFDRQ